MYNAFLTTMFAMLYVRVGIYAHGKNTCMTASFN